MIHSSINSSSYSVFLQVSDLKDMTFLATNCRLTFLNILAYIIGAFCSFAGFILLYSIFYTVSYERLFRSELDSINCKFLKIEDVHVRN